MNNSQYIEEFLSSAESFVSWIKSPPQDPKEEAASALATLSKLYADSLNLMRVDVDRDESGYEPEECRVSPDEWKEVYERLNHFPFTYYQACESPHDSDTEAVFTDLVEDLTDIYQDVAEGVSLYKADQHEYALCHWQMTFEFHWGKHCLGAMKALHIWFQDESDFQFFQS